VRLEAPHSTDYEKVVVRDRRGRKAVHNLKDMELPDMAKLESKARGVGCFPHFP